MTQQDPTPLPELFAYLPDNEPLAALAEDGKSIAIHLDLDHPLTSGDGELTGDHHLELSLTDAARLSAAIQTQLATALDLQEQKASAELHAHLTEELTQR
ncbi:hypothetical protein GCM10009592_28320 [Brachybacterium rhamnosum]|uniref:Uncharacterized protein n=1 Tax=Brachybacterium rhamnosum TaxID=173361 RepID=A0ABW4Q3P5_9MICO